MKKQTKTNVARLLDNAHIEYNLIPYAVDENNLAADHVAAELGEDINRVFKTLVLRASDGDHLVCVVPGNREVDLKKSAREAGKKKVEMIPMKELLPLTGYIRGGCSPIGMKKQFPTFFHSTITDFEHVYVSAGIRGLQLKISPSALVDYVGGMVADIATE